VLYERRIGRLQPHQTQPPASLASLVEIRTKQEREATAARLLPILPYACNAMHGGRVIPGLSFQKPASVQQDLTPEAAANHHRLALSTKSSIPGRSHGHERCDICSCRFVNAQSFVPPNRFLLLHRFLNAISGGSSFVRCNVLNSSSGCKSHQLRASAECRRLQHVPKAGPTAEYGDS
jgi:hypothetical protein